MTVGQAVKAKAMFLKENKGATPVNTNDKDTNSLIADRRKV